VLPNKYIEAVRKEKDRNEQGWIRQGNKIIKGSNKSEIFTGTAGCL
jgi:hypothetical protein